MLDPAQRADLSFDAFFTHAVIRPELQRTLDSLAGVPVDLEPIYPLAR